MRSPPPTHTPSPPLGASCAAKPGVGSGQGLAPWSGIEARGAHRKSWAWVGHRRQAASRQRAEPRRQPQAPTTAHHSHPAATPVQRRCQANVPGSRAARARAPARRWRRAVAPRPFPRRRVRCAASPARLARVRWGRGPRGRRQAADPPRRFRRRRRRAAARLPDPSRVVVQRQLPCAAAAARLLQQQPGLRRQPYQPRSPAPPAPGPQQLRPGL